jgi:RNA polymerase-binding protein DksA
MTTDTLTPEIRNELELALRRERDSLRHSVRWLGDSVRTLGDSQALEGPGQQADVASDEAEEEVDLALQTAARRKLAEVEAALRRLDDGTYGICENCGKPISLERLRAVPWTTLCLVDSTKGEPPRG